MQTQSSQFGESWAYVRDNAVGVSANDGRELFHITKVEFLPPSKAHLKRLSRARPISTPIRRKPTPENPSFVALNHRRCLALNILAINSPNKAEIIRNRGKTSEQPARPSPPFVPKASPSPSSTTEAISWRRNENQKRHLLAMAKLRKPRPLTLDQLCDVFALFGNYANFLQEARV